MENCLKRITLLFLLLPFAAFADKGMWIPKLLSNNAADMQAKGLQISTSDIYSEDSASLKDAVVKFGGGCTGGIVSDKGLIITNHHCGFDNIQKLSTLENNYLEKGFWASSFEQELPCKGLTVTLLVSIHNVSTEILRNLPSDISEKARHDSVAKRSKLICELAVKGTHYKAEVVPFYNGNEYYLMVNEVFEDIRLVGTPPVSIGKFGGDTDNWMYPRHTGDFSIFRIYVDSNNRPAPYSENNVPYKPRKYFEVSLDSISEDDFTFVFGYPARTNEYLSSYGVELIVDVIDPLSIEARTKRLDIIKGAMAADSVIRLQYASKAANIANAWKKWQGEVLGIQRNGTIERKLKYEETLTSAQGLINQLAQEYDNLIEYKKIEVLFKEYELAPDAMRFAYLFRSLSTEKAVSRIISEMKDYSPVVDKKIFASLAQAATPEQIELFYKKSVFTDAKRFADFAALPASKATAIAVKDPLYKYVCERAKIYDSFVAPGLALYGGKIDSLQRLFMWEQKLHGSSLPEQASESKPLVFPDANFTLRVSYGNIKGFAPADGVYYEPFSTLDGVIEKAATGIYDYVLDPTLASLYENKDFGLYTRKDGKVPVCFIATNHTTGGNSGSPVLNGNGKLIGINFDRCWEGTMSDIDFDLLYCRNIILDIRYLMFIIDKFANSQRLVKEIVSQQ
jgi:hypothetical protein